VLLQVLLKYCVFSRLWIILRGTLQSYFVVSCLALPVFAQGVRPEKSTFEQVSTEHFSLEQCVARAQAQHERVQERAVELQRTQAEFDEAVAALRPDFSIQALTRLRNDASFVGSGSGASGDSSDTETRSARKAQHGRYEAYLLLQQPIFQGFRLQLYRDASAREVEARAFELKRERELLALDVVDAFFQLQLYQQDAEILQRLVSVLKEREQELQRFVRLGRARESELLAARADRLDVEALHDSTRGLGELSRELLAQLLLLPAEQLRIVDHSGPPLTRPLERVLEELPKRADLSARVADLAALEARLQAARAEHYPSLDLEATAYGIDDPDSGRELEASLRLQIPLFDGGARQARVAQTRAEVLKAQTALARLTREAQSEIRQQYIQLAAAQREVQSLEKVTQATDKSVQLQRRDYELGAVTNLDVRQALRAAENAKRRLLERKTEAARLSARIVYLVGGTT
jgi:outer membrane protein TolC